ncbi:MAG: beta-N-acetylhexosaminidase [Halobacteriovoraceae bacterium]|nr:beta-N-acetylhexosaminidase [Halobacteriovoraceae bacterium]
MKLSNLGQLIMTGISGKVLTDIESEFISNSKIGGVLLFANNYESPTQLAELVNSIQALRDESPLFIAVDQEGGRVRRFKEHLTQFPAMLELAKTNSPKVCFTVAKIMAEELLALGVNVNFAPCCDVLTHEENQVIGDRAFGRDAETVSKYISSIIRGLQTNSILACAKHFPGHGATAEDSHFELPYLEKSLEELEGLELIPFVKAVKSRVEFVMMAHIRVDAFDNKLPASLAPEAYQYLRNELRYKKIIITDDMQMEAITKNYSVGGAAVKAIKAGADIVEYRDMNLAREAYLGLEQAVDSGELTREIVNDRSSRILETKKLNFAEYQPIFVPEVTKKLNSRGSQIFLEEISKSIADSKTGE